MTRERVRRLLDDGLTISEIAARLALAKSSVSYHARRLGHVADGRYARRYDWAAIRSYYDEGHSVEECRARFGFSMSAWSDAIRRGDVRSRPGAAELQLYLCPDSAASRSHLKRRLLREGLKRDVCERCGISEWRGRPLTVALHHVNGDGDDNRLENLLLLCPNCHSQTANYGGRNRARSSGSVPGANVRNRPESASA